jgi:hypothetical protein
MKTEDRIIFFLASEQQTDEVVDLMRIAKKLPARIDKSHLIKYCDIKKKSAEEMYKKDSRKTEYVNKYMTWQRIINLLNQKNE